MAHSYTPGLRVSRLTRIVKERRLPLKGKVSVNVGDRVTALQVVASTDLPGNVHPVNCASQLGIVPADIEATLKVQPGSKISKGQTIATSTSFFGLFKSHCLSPIDGTLEAASPITGQLILREPPIPVEVLAYVDGKVTELFADEGVKVETLGAMIQGIFGIGGERYGRIKISVDSQQDVLDEDSITEDVKGCILIGGSLVTLGAFKKAIRMGAVAVVAGGFLNDDLKSLLGYEQGVAITGHEDIDCSLIITEGFGRITMAHRTFDLLKENENRGASVSGATQIRAGVIRPEVIIPTEDVTELPEQTSSITGLEIGDQVRVIRQPYFGSIGTVSALPSELQQIETGAKVRVLEISFDSKEKVVLPRANIEIIEE